MKGSKSLARKLSLVLVLTLVSVGLSAAVIKSMDYSYSPLDKEFYLTQEQMIFLRPGLNVDVTEWAIAEDGTVTVRVEVTDDSGQPLDLNGVFTPGSIRLSFVLGTIPQGGQWYQSYITRNASSDITGETAVQPTSDSGGNFEEIEPGVYIYTYGTKLPAGYDMDATHSIGWYAQRDLSDWDLPSAVSDGVLTFVPSGGEVETIRSIVSNEACARCHDPLILHGRRHSVELCIMCHYEGVIDPDTGNTVDMREMIHKIHYGEDLTNGYTIIGYRNSVHDYSHVVLPQDIRNCETCHDAETASQAEAAYLNPTRAACGSCHDDVIWESGEGHAGGAQVSDNMCANCHMPEGELEYDASVKGAHTIESKSAQLAGINVTDVVVTNNGPGGSIDVTFTMTNDDGTPIDMAEMNRMRLQIAGPSGDYTSGWREDVVAGAVPAGGGSFRQATGTYTLSSAQMLPEDASGTWAVGFNGRRIVTLNAGTTKEREVRETMENEVFYTAVTDAEAVPRRAIVDDAKCEECHEDLAMHGSNYHNASGYCQLCHTPMLGGSDEEEPGDSATFPLLIHRIHNGANLTRDYFEGEFSEVHYPGDLRNCAKCHVGDSWEGGRGVAATPTPLELYSPMLSTSVACLGCHDSEPAQAHAYLNTAPFGEACTACHADGKKYSVASRHAR
ncbi:MAG: OmcA/MtrC family decaheme c-type cytochrome [Acidobacteriota bacterium]|nr:MAG: OmcA/MtrC family decaheme c-type cytochrome [Acidobacteriota bacterium]